MSRPSLFGLLFATALLLDCPSAGTAAAAAGRGGGHPVAVLGGRLIDLRDIGLHHCHNLVRPVYRCFATAAQRDRDVRRIGVQRHAIRERSDLHGEMLLLAEYVTWFEHSSYGGASFTAADPEPDLGAIGWNNQISSFKSKSGGHPKWWAGTGYSGTAWQWSMSAWVSYVGDDANDTWSSVKHVT